MKFRRAIRAVGTTAAVGAAAAIPMLAFAGPAGADLTTGQQIQAAIPISPDPTSGQTVLPGKPFSSGQTIEVKVPPNTLWANNQNIHIEECNAPGGVIPSGTPQCDNNTLYYGTIPFNQSTGFDITDFVVYALPSSSFGESGSSATVCDPGHPCVLYIGPNAADPGQPKIWSQVFTVQKNDSFDLGTNPGDGTPELPLAIGLPLAAGGILGGTVLIRRRRAMKASA